MRVVQLLVGMLLLAPACGMHIPDVCSEYKDRTCIALVISSNQTSRVDQLALKGVSGLTLDALTPLNTGPSVSLPVVVAIDAGMFSGDFSIRVHGLLQKQEVGEGQATSSIIRGEHKQINVLLGMNTGIDAGAADLPLPGFIVATINPAIGPTAGGTTIVIDGTGFLSDSIAITIGGRPATSVQRLSPTRIQAITPAAAPEHIGKTDVIVATNGESRNIIFHYYTDTLALQKPNTATFFKDASRMLADDFNDDHIIDLLIQQSLASGFGILLGKGGGDFWPASQYFASSCVGTNVLAAGDLDNDGHVDIITADGTICFGDGKGGDFSRHFYTNAGGEDAKFADLNGDGKTDIVMRGATALLLIINRSTPGKAAFDAPVRPPDRVTCFALGDMDQDGDVDIVYDAYNGDGIAVMQNDGASNFTTSIIGITKAPPAAKAIGIADFTGDKLADIAVSRGTSYIVVLKQVAPRQFAALPETYYVENTKNLLTADLDDDSNTDLAIFTGDGVQIFWGFGNGTFHTNGGFLAPGAGLAADLNRDGRLDLIAGYQDVTILLSKGARDFSGLPTCAVGPPANLLPYGNRSLVALAAADFDGNHIADLFQKFDVSGKDAGPALFLQVKPGGDNPELLPNTACNGSHLVTGDLDGLGGIDIISSCGSVWLNQGMQRPRFTTSGFLGNPAYPLAVALLDADIRLDLVTPAGVQPGLGNGTFGPLMPISFPGNVLPGDIVALATGDINGDKNNDLLFADNRRNQILQYLGDGTGRISATESISLPAPPVAVIVADFDRDGKADAAILTDGNIIIHYRSGAREDTIPVVGMANMLVSDDMNGDDYADLIYDGGVAINPRVAGNPFKTFPIPVSATESHGIIQVGDFDGDGRNDIATANRRGTATIIVRNLSR